MRLRVGVLVLALAGCVPEGRTGERPEAPPPLPHLSAERPVMERPEVTRSRPHHRPSMKRPAAVGIDFGEEWKKCDQYDPLFVQAARRHLPWGAKGEGARWLKAQAIEESSCRRAVCSDKGACGLMAHLEGTARDLGMTDRTDPAQSIAGGAKYDAWLYGQYRAHNRTVVQRWHAALDGYNRGLGNTLDDQREFGCINWAPCWRFYAPDETRNYVESISARVGYPIKDR